MSPGFQKMMLVFSKIYISIQHIYLGIIHNEKVEADIEESGIRHFI